MKIIQIAVPGYNGFSRLYALADNGTIWERYCDYGSQSWREVELPHAFQRSDAQIQKRKTSQWVEEGSESEGS